MLTLEPTSFESETRVITLDQLRVMQKRGRQLIDQLAAVSGYCQIVLHTDLEPIAQLHLEKICHSVSRAAHSVQGCLAMVNEIEKSGSV